MSVAKLSLYLLAVGVALSAASAGAQAPIPMDVEVLIDGKNQKENIQLFVNKEQCEQDVPIEVILANLGGRPNLEVVEFWVEQQGGADCHKASGRSRNADDDTIPCVQVGEPIQNPDAEEQPVSFTARELFGDENGSCSRINDQYLYVVPLQNVTEAGSEQDGIGNAIRILFTVDVNPLPAPSSVNGGSGETQARVSWEQPSGAEPETDYQLFFDTTAIVPEGDAECTSDLLVEGEEVDSNAEGLESRTANGASANVDPGSLGLDLNQMLPAVVVAIDEAGNRSVASEVVCVKRVPTSGFWDACQAEKDCREGFDSCSLSHHSRQSWLGSSLALIGLALWLRRRRTV